MTKKLLFNCFFLAGMVWLVSCSQPVAPQPTNTPLPTNTPPPTPTPEPTPTDAPPTISAEFQSMSQDEKDKELIKATQKDDAVKITDLLAAGADINASDKLSGFTPIVIATVRNNLEIFKLLQEAGADLQQIDKRNNTLLHHAAFENDAEIGAILLAEGDFDLEARRSQYGFTPLLVAAFEGHVEMVELLVEHGADIEAGDDWGDTPLNVSAWNGKHDVVEKLIELGAILEVENSSGHTALNHAKNQGHEEVEKLIAAALEN